MVMNRSALLERKKGFKGRELDTRIWVPAGIADLVFIDVKATEDMGTGCGGST